jgi:DNA replication and repair protein RecF
MRMTRIALRDFRCYSDAEGAELALGAGLTIVWGENGSGKTSLLEGLYFGCTGRSFRTSDERRLVRAGAAGTRVVVSGVDGDGRPHEFAVGFEPGVGKRMTFDGVVVERLLDLAQRPLISVFSPDRLEVIKGGPGLRRAHLDHLVAAMWPARALTRREYVGALAQRNALLGRVRSGRVGAEALAPWNETLAEAGARLAGDRHQAVESIAAPFVAHAEALGLSGAVTLAYRSRSLGLTAGELAAEIERGTGVDLARGHTTRGPHRDDLVIARNGRTLRDYGSQGEQRLALLALLLAERDVLEQQRGQPLLLLLDDVMSELDVERRGRLAEELRRAGGQSVVTTAELEHVPGWDGEDVVRIGLS